MAKIHVRTANGDDIAQLSVLGRDVFYATYGATSDADDIERHVEVHFGQTAIADVIASGKAQYLIATDGPNCAGFVKLCDGSAHELVPAATAVEVRQLYVATDYQRRGVGRMLMDAAIGVTKQRGAAGVWLSVWTKADWATSFYTNYGFRSLGEVPFMIGVTEYVDFLMWLEVGST